MGMSAVMIIFIALGAALGAALITYFVVSSTKNASLKALEDKMLFEREAHREYVSKIESDHQTAIERMERHQKEILEATKSALQAENENALKAREESLKQEAQQTIQTVAGPLKQQIESMTKAFEAQKEAHVREISSIKTQFEQTAKEIGTHTEKIGERADKLSDALRHGNKIQGNWGEMQLENIFNQEGFAKGRDYDREEYLRDERGEIITNHTSGKKMRPDFIFHFPDNTDVIIDSKVNMDAYVDWHNADDQLTKDEACRRNLAALKAQIKNLSGKNYNEYLREGRKSLPFVVMYVANYGALALAKTSDPEIVNDAYRSNVVITTEETIMPLLFLIRYAWRGAEQIRNQEEIVKNARYMIDRVSELCESHAVVGAALNKALDAHRLCSVKLAQSGSSIVTAAKNIERLGVQAKEEKMKHINAAAAQAEQAANLLAE